MINDPEMLRLLKGKSKKKPKEKPLGCPKCKGRIHLQDGLLLCEDASHGPFESLRELELI